MGQKTLSESDINTILQKTEDIQMSKTLKKEEKETMLDNLYDEYEYDLEFIGCSAIEDQLQEDVPQTIAKLIEAEIRVWVLTGDKQETAIEIGKSCKLIQKDFE